MLEKLTKIDGVTATSNDNTAGGAEFTLSFTGKTAEEARDNVNRILCQLFQQSAQYPSQVHKADYEALPADPVKKAAFEALLSMDPIDFLKEVTYNMAPETVKLAGPAVPSPEHNPLLLPEALAYQVFDEKTLVHETAVEADRTFTSLLLYRAARMSPDKKPAEFPKLTDDQYAKMVAFTNSIIKNEHDEEIMIYSLAAQDLGKTLDIMKSHTTLFTESAKDHDHLLYELTRDHPQLFPGYQKLPAAGQSMYLQGLDGDLNLGQFAQGENLPCNLSRMMSLDEKTRQIRLLTEFYDFAGATGHVKPGISILLNSENLFAYQAAIDALQQPDSLSAYAAYIQKRGVRAGLVTAGDDITSDAEKFALCRIAALSRAFDTDKGDQIRDAWNGLDAADRKTLSYEMSLTGLDPEQQRGILVYYAPGMIANAVAATASFKDGVSLSLQAMANVYRATRKIVFENGKGQTTVDVNNLAVLAKTDPQKIAVSYPAKPEGPFKRLTLDITP